MQLKKMVMNHRSQARPPFASTSTTMKERHLEVEIPSGYFPPSQKHLREAGAVALKYFTKCRPQWRFFEASVILEVSILGHFSFLLISAKILENIPNGIQGCSILQCMCLQFFSANGKAIPYFILGLFPDQC